MNLKRKKGKLYEKFLDLYMKKENGNIEATTKSTKEKGNILWTSEEHG